MQNANVKIIEFDNSLHRAQVVALWKAVFGVEKAHNDPELSIDKKIPAKDGLFFVAEGDGKVIGTTMAGYDGHRGWIYSVAVHPDHQKQGIGSQLLTHAQEKLVSLGCLKVNL